MKAYGYRLKNSQDDKYYSLPYFPVGFIIHMMENTNPNGLLIGKWERLKGRVLVGVDENDPDFNVPNKIGGSKTSYIEADGQRNNDEGTDWTYQGINVNSRAFSILQPYITCYMWVRIA